MQELAVRAALAHRRPGALGARDALGADGSRRELSRAHSLHIAPLHFRFFFLASLFCAQPLRLHWRTVQPCARRPLLRNVFVFFETTLVFAVISDQKSPVVVRWLSLRGSEPCGTLTQDTFLSRDELVLCEAANAQGNTGIPLHVLPCAW